MFRAHLERAGSATQVFPLDKHGDCILAKVPGSAGAGVPQDLLLGHMDTEFPDGTAAARAGSQPGPSSLRASAACACSERSSRASGAGAQFE